MNEIQGVLRRAGARLLFVHLLRTGVMTLSAGLGIVILLRLVERLFGLTLPWTGIAAGLGVGVAIGASAWAIIARPRGVRLAREVDDRADLREALSTALCLSGRDDPWSVATIESARDRARRVVVKDAIPIAAPRYLPVPLALALGLVVVWIAVPRVDVLGLWGAKEKERKAQAEVVRAEAQIKTRQDKLEEILSRAKVEGVGAPDKDSLNEKPDPKDADSLRRAEVKRLVAIQDALADKKASEPAKQLEAMKDMLEQLKQPGPGPMQELSRSIARGDLSQAQQKLDELGKQLAEGKMSPEQKQQLKQQLDQMAKQIEKLAEDRRGVENELQKAGLSADQAKQAARNPEVAKELLEKLENLTPEQKEALAKMASAQCKACESMGQMSQAMGKMAQGMSDQSMDQEGMEGMQSLGEMLSEMEMAEAEMQAADAAMSEAMSQLAQSMSECNGDGQGLGMSMALNPSIGDWKPGDSSRRGIGSGGPGKGGGPNTGAQEAAYDSKLEKSPTNAQAGPSIGSKLVFGEQVRGESVAEFSEAVEAAVKQSSESINNNQYPREYHEAIKAYLGRLEAAAKAAEKNKKDAK